MQNKKELKIGLIGEGKNDIGVQGKNEWEFGVMPDYLNLLFGNDFELEFIPIHITKEDTKKLKQGRGGKYSKTIFKGVSKKLERFLINYKSVDFDILVFFSDTDKMQGKRATEKEAKQQYCKIKSNIEYGFTIVNKRFSELHCVVMIPIRIVECWLLGDIEGFKGIGCSTQDLPKKPEFIWGDKYDPKSNYPKNYLKHILENCNYTDNTEIFKNIVCHNDIKNLRKNCPNSFDIFYQDIENIKTNI